MPEEPGEYHVPPSCLIAMSIGAGVGLATMGLVTIALPFIGFGAAGPIAGSFAAWVQSIIGAEVAAGSAFALLQSLAAAGWSFSTGALITGSSASLALAICQALGFHDGNVGGSGC